MHTLTRSNGVPQYGLPSRRDRTDKLAPYPRSQVFFPTRSCHAERLASLLLRDLPNGFANNEQSHSRASGRIGVHYEKHAHVQIAAPTSDTAGANPLSL